MGKRKTPGGLNDKDVPRCRPGFLRKNFGLGSVGAFCPACPASVASRVRRARLVGTVAVDVGGFQRETLQRYIALRGKPQLCSGMT